MVPYASRGFVVHHLLIIAINTDNCVDRWPYIFTQCDDVSAISSSLKHKNFTEIFHETTYAQKYAFLNNSTREAAFAVLRRYNGHTD